MVGRSRGRRDDVFATTHTPTHAPHTQNYLFMCIFIYIYIHVYIYIYIYIRMHMHTTYSHHHDVPTAVTRVCSV